jgi:hypothetical protein
MQTFHYFEGFGEKIVKNLFNLVAMKRSSVILAYIGISSKKFIAGILLTRLLFSPFDII